MVIVLLNVKRKAVFQEILKGYFLFKKQSVKFIDFDGSKKLRDILNLNEQNFVLNIKDKTTKLLNEFRECSKIDMFIIETNQELDRVVKIYNFIKEFNKRVIFALEVKNTKRIKFQHCEFFQKEEFKNRDYFIFLDSQIIYLIQETRQTIFEFANDNVAKEKVKISLQKAFDENNKEQIEIDLVVLDIFEESEKYYKNILKPAFEVIDKKL